MTRHELTYTLNKLAEGLDGKMQRNTSPMTPEEVVNLFNVCFCLSETELVLVLDRMVAAQKAEGYATFAEFITAMIFKVDLDRQRKVAWPAISDCNPDELMEAVSAMQAVMEGEPQLTEDGILDADHLRRSDWIANDCRPRGRLPP
jgi:hypothetical protein